MKNGRKIIQIDYILQSLIGAIYLFTGVLGIGFAGLWIIAALCQFALGVIQLLSACTFLALGHRETARIQHFAAALVTLALLAVFAYTGIESISIGAKIIPAVLFIIFPLILAIWYYNITIRTKEFLSRLPVNEKHSDLELENILDSQELR